ncbi:hypothetical protein [Janibacter indicus]|uniref:Uncharacterized protein n=1 Tax=Janibacter indicus TaxID=857417 RepID=A0A1W2CU48_9MICO|nr:hypothetical protein [Janibacter indicus]SMC88733.1 hypothetical protein SAMN06296429_112126 [Janibacter indicus]
MSRRSRRVVVVALAVAGMVVPVLLAAAQYPTWWVWIAPEQVPMTWFQSVTLVVAGVMSLLAWYVAGIIGRGPRLGHSLLAVGFLALALDERFALHERVRDGILAPRDVRLPGLTWVAPGDFILILVALAGLLVLPLVVRSLGRDRWVRGLFVLGIGLSVVSVGTDSIDPSTWSVQAERVQQSLEECVELWAGLSYLAAVTLRLLGLVDRLAQRSAAEPVVAVGAPRDGAAHEPVDAPIGSPAREVDPEPVS